MYLNKEPHEDLGRDLEAMEQSPEDAGYLPLDTTTEEGESLSQLFEYTLPDWALTTMTIQLRMKRELRYTVPDLAV
jgi:hypothetical protein